MTPFDVTDVELNDDFRAALGLIAGGSSLFLTGKAGTGKSTFLKYLRATTTQEMAVVAPTGLAAVNVGGQTAHSLFSFPPRVIDPAKVQVGRNANVLKRLDLLVVDEVSMVRVDLMDGIDRCLRLCKGRDLPFGGVQMVLIGDLFQLPPVVREHEVKKYFAESYGGPYFFHAPVFQETGIGLLDLQKVYRQTDTAFLELLNAIRAGRCDGRQFDMLNKRVGGILADENVVTLTPTNAAATRINQTHLDRLPGPEHAYDATIDGKFDESAYPTDASLRLRVGARVMMLRNGNRWCNGTLATISKLGETINVEINGNSYELGQHTWENLEYDLIEHRITERVVGTFRQFPLRLAWGLTIHKSQGQTLDRVHLDLGSGAFAHGQTYVALSRCRWLEVISLKRPVFATDLIVDPAVHTYKSVFPDARSRTA